MKPALEVIDGRRYTTPALAMPAAVYRETDHGVDWLGIATISGAYEWKLSASVASTMTMRDAITLAKLHDGHAAFVQLLRCALPPAAIINGEDDIADAVAEAEASADDVDLCVMSTRANAEWRKAMVAQ